MCADVASKKIQHLLTKRAYCLAAGVAPPAIVEEQAALSLPEMPSVVDVCMQGDDEGAEHDNGVDGDSEEHAVGHALSPLQLRPTATAASPLSAASAHRFQVQVIVDAWIFAQHLAPGTSLKQACELCLNLVLTDEARAQVQASLASGRIVLPGREILRQFNFKLDRLLILWERHLLAVNTSYRYLQADSSPQLGWNFFALIEYRLSWPKVTPLKQQVFLDMREAFSTRHLPLTALGYGRSAVADKAAATTHVLLLESGGQSLFNKLRCEVRGWSSDRGVERHVVDGPCLNPAQLSLWEEKVEELGRKTFALNDASGCMLYMFPYAIYMPDMLHQLFGALEEAIVKNEEWKVVLDSRWVFCGPISFAWRQRPHRGRSNT